MNIGTMVSLVVAFGKVQIRNMNGDIKKFPDDFGQQIDYRFTIDHPLRLDLLGKAVSICIQTLQVIFID